MHFIYLPRLQISDPYIYHMKSFAELEVKYSVDISEKRQKCTYPHSSFINLSVSFEHLCVAQILKCFHVTEREGLCACFDVKSTCVGVHTQALLAQSCICKCSWSQANMSEIQRG